MRKLLLIPLALGLVACGPPTRTQARDEMSNRSCDYYERCGNVGPGKDFADRDACMIDQRGFWDDLWTVGKCEDRMNEEGLRNCYDRVDIAQCGGIQGGLDLVNILLSCSSDNVCGGV